MDVKTGTRLRCESCGAEFIVVNPGPAELTCCGTPLTDMPQPGAKPH